MDETVGDRVAFAFENSLYGDLSQRDQAKLLSMNQPDFNKSLHGKRNFKPEELVRVSDLTKFDLRWLIVGDR